MKKLFKNNIFGFVIGGFIFGVIGVGASTLYQANQITYNDSDVKTALNELYDGLKNSVEISRVETETITGNFSLD